MNELSKHQNTEEQSQSISLYNINNTTETRNRNSLNDLLTCKKLFALCLHLLFYLLLGMSPLVQRQSVLFSSLYSLCYTMPSSRKILYPKKKDELFRQAYRLLLIASKSQLCTDYWSLCPKRYREKSSRWVPI